MPVADSIPALTLWQPWASLLTEGVKWWETRSWRPPESLIGRRIAIHAAARRMPQAEMASMPELAAICAREHLVLSALPYGAVIGTVRVVAAYRTTLVRIDLGEQRALGDWSVGRWAWRLNDVVEFSDPIPCLGLQRLWTWAPSGVCLVCGCTDSHGCPDGCQWVDDHCTLCDSPECVRLATEGGMMR
jgi:hypothetical protein